MLNPETLPRPVLGTLYMGRVSRSQIGRPVKSFPRPAKEFLDPRTLRRDNRGTGGTVRRTNRETHMTDSTYYTRPEILTATVAEWHVRGCAGFPACPGCRFPKNHTIVTAHADTLAGLQRNGGLVVPAPTFGKASNVIRRMASDSYTDPKFGTVADATETVPADIFHTFDVWERGPGHVVRPDAMRPKLSQTLRRIIARLPERGIRPNVAIQAHDDSIDVTAYRLA